MNIRAIARLMPVILLLSALLNATLADSKALELFYDDGTSEACGIGSTSDVMRFLQVVLFQSPWELTQLIEVKLYIAAHAGYAFKLHVMDNDKSDILIDEISTQSDGWLVVDLASRSIVVPQEFYIGMETFNNIPPSEGVTYEYVPCLGMDNTSPDGKSWWVIMDPIEDYWIHMEFWDYMIRAVVSPPVTAAAINVDPDTLSLKSKGKWITAYIQLPEGYDPADIDASTVLLNGTLAPVLDPKYGFVTDSSEYLVDHNGDGILERMVKFDRAMVQSFIYDQGITYGNAALAIAGSLFDGTAFEGTDVVSVNCAGDANHDGKVNVFDICMVKAYWGTDYPDTDFNKDSTTNTFDILILKANWGQATP